jgi:hypothetical protein
VSVEAVHRGRETDPARRGPDAVVDDLEFADPAGEVGYLPHLHREDRTVGCPGVIEFGPAGWRSQRGLREREHEEVTGPDLAQDLPPPGLPARDLLITPHVSELAQVLDEGPDHRLIRPGVAEEEHENLLALRGV